MNQSTSSPRPSPPSDGGEGVVRAARDMLPRLMTQEIAV